jgi:hypothetical protein
MLLVLTNMLKEGQRVKRATSPQLNQLLIMKTAKLLTPEQVMERFAISRLSLRNLEKSGVLKPVRLNRRTLRYAESELEKLVSLTSKPTR